MKTNGTAEGNERWDFTWSDQSRLLRVVKGVYDSSSVLVTEFDVSYDYDQAGRMLRRSQASIVTWMTWDGWVQISETSAETQTQYLAPSGLIHGFIRNEEHFTAFRDALGSVRTITDSAGIVVARFEYGARGEILPGTFDLVPGGTPYLYVGAAGVRTDGTTGLVWMRQRWYDPSAGSFLSRDPLGLAGSENLYAYTACDPINNIDPSGEVAPLIGWLIIAGEAGLAGGASSVVVGGAIRWCLGKKVVDEKEIKLDFAGGFVLAGGLSGVKNLWTAYKFRNAAPAINEVDETIRAMAASEGIALAGGQTTAKGFLLQFNRAGGRFRVVWSASGQKVVPGLLPPTYENALGAIRHTGNPALWDAERTILERLFPYIGALHPSRLVIFISRGSCPTCQTAARQFGLWRPLTEVVMVGAGKRGVETYYINMAENLMVGAAGSTRNSGDQ